MGTLVGTLVGTPLKKEQRHGRFDHTIKNQSHRTFFTIKQYFEIKKWKNFRVLAYLGEKAQLNTKREKHLLKSRFLVFFICINDQR